MNIIAIDPSLSCTALVVNGKRHVFANESMAHTDKMALKKWFKMCAASCNYHFHTQFASSGDHTTDEVIKFKKFNLIIDEIISTIKSEIVPGKNTICGIEGYSYSSMAGPLIDLVTFGTLLRSKLVSNGIITVDDLHIFPPSKLKLEAAKLTYPAIQKGKKIEYRNNNGVAGGSFKKPDMFMALIENDSLTDDWVTFLRDNQKDISESKSIPKPVEDINDAYLMFEVLRKQSTS